MVHADPASHHPHAPRVVEVQVGPKRVGSGYLLTDRLVLTAHHVIATDGPVVVRPLDIRRSAPLKASRLWPLRPVEDRTHPEQDVALLLTETPAEWPVGRPAGGSVRFGDVAGDDRVACHALGFPDAERRPDGDRDMMSLRGYVEPTQGMRFGLLTLYAELLLHDVRERRWGGMSGGPLFTDDGLLLGVLIEDRNHSLNRTALRAVSISRMLDLPGFAAVLADHGVASRISHNELERYLRAAAEHADDQPYAGVVGGRKPRLHEVHLRQRVRCLREEATDAPGGGRPSLTSPAVLLSADDVLAAGPACLVLAGPGGGKSSLLRTWLTDAVARRTAGDDGAPVPVLVPAKALMDQNGKLAGDKLSAALAHAAHSEVLLDMRKLFSGRPPGGGCWLVLVDGLDEIPSSATRIRLLRHLALLAEEGDAGPYRFVVATRPLPDRELDRLGAHLPRFDLLPFGRDELPEVARGWFTALGVADPGGTAERFVTEALARDPLPELARTPLMAGLLCQLYARNPEGMLPGGRGEIYDDFVELLRQHQAADDIWEAALDLAGHIAALRLGVRESPPRPREEPLDTLLKSWPGKPPSGMTLKETVLRSGLLTDRAGELEFLQQTFLEHCAAQYATRTPDDCERETQRLLGDRWVRQRPTRKVHFAWWGRRYWNAPDDEQASYTGFLLDRLLNERTNPAAAQVGRELQKLTGRSNLRGCCFLAEQKHLGTALPGDVVDAAADSLRHTARITDRDRRMAYLRANPHELPAEAQGGIPPEFYLARAERSARVNAAQALWWLGDDHATDILAEIAATPYLTGNVWRADAAGLLCDVEDDRGLPLLHTLATDSSNPNETRIEAATLLVGFGDERGVQLLDDFARDTKGFMAHERADALKALAEWGHERSADVLDGFARDPGAPPSLRNWAAQMLTCIGDARGPALLDDFAHHTAHKSRLRLIAARVLAKHDPERGAVVLAELAQDRTIRRRHRRIAESLSG
ncbi:trypsin-like peptidase domain-containing protein [Streptomyces sp. NPDC020801]|uniref:trypsin-like peptidase domain-containing protein n=1 Tax=unclassified Streptomyces TaxID=2593676 RepID=UPI00379E0A98